MTVDRRVVVWDVAPDALNAVGRALYGESADARQTLAGIADAIAGTPIWSEEDRDVVVVSRGGPTPLIAVVGLLTDRSQQFIAALADGLDARLRDLRYIDYRSAEAIVGVLADRLRAQIPDLGDRAFRAVPRGGHVVLGLLAVILDLHPRQLTLPSAADQPVVLVDDCLLTGHHVGRYLETEPSEDVVVAHLLSPPALRAAMESQVAHVTACVAADDLADHAPALLGDDYAAWRRDTLAAVPPPRYWIGRPEPVAFPWNEVDWPLWDASAGRYVTGWRIVPPDRCLMPRHRDRVRVHHMDAQRGPWALAPGAVEAPLDEALILAPRHGEAPLALTGRLRALWETLWDAPSDLADPLTAAASRQDCPSGSPATEVAQLRGRLGAAGLLAGTHDGDRS